MSDFNIHQFWIDNFPYFLNDAYFIYYILDLVSIISFLKIFFALPSYLLGFSRKDRGFKIWKI